MWDVDMRLDQQLGQFMTALDQGIGAGKWAMIVTSDHGASPLPESIKGGRITFDQIRSSANAAAAAVLGPGTWIDNAHYPNVYFSKAMLAQPKGELDSAQKKVIYALRSFPGVEQVGLVSDYAGHCETRTGQAQELCLTFDPERSGDVFYLPAAGWIFEDASEPEATAHGSLHDYDLLVPVILMAPDRKPHLAQRGPADGHIEMTKISSLLARWLGVTPPLAMPRPAPVLPVLVPAGSGSGLAPP
jgi:hypothetical protein